MKYRGLAVFPLKREMAFFCEAMRREGLSVSSFRGERSTSKIVEELGLICGVGGHGKVQFALGTQRLLLDVGPVEHLFCLGAGGGLQSEMIPGDVVIGEWTIEHDYKERLNSSQEMPSFRADSALVKALHLNKGSGFSIYIGAIASGDEDIVEVDRAEELVLQTRALAVAWEGAGGARAGRFHRVPFVEVRGITDKACGGERVFADFERNLNVAMKNVAQVIKQGLQIL